MTRPDHLRLTLASLIGGCRGHTRGYLAARVLTPDERVLDLRFRASPLHGAADGITRLADQGSTVMVGTATRAHRDPASHELIETAALCVHCQTVESVAALDGLPAASALICRHDGSEGVAIYGLRRPMGPDGALLAARRLARQVGAVPPSTTTHFIPIAGPHLTIEWLALVPYEPDELLTSPALEAA